MVKVDALFISDVHLGSKKCKAKQLIKFLDKYEFKKLYLVGDIIDFWKFHSKFHWPSEHSKLIRKVLKLAEKKVEVKYIIGNHDDQLKDFIGLNFSGIEICDKAEYDLVYDGGDRIKYLVIHGDIFDHPWMKSWFIEWLGPYFQEIFLNISNTVYMFFRKHGVKFKEKLTDYEDKAVSYAHNRGYDAVITGHTHIPKIVGPYLNCGDWTGNNTAIVAVNGKLELIKDD
jgi:UDP-2,3-diacylglucosamine pyrophosphatase LpxH